jgi:hypothetical protein
LLWVIFWSKVWGAMTSHICWSRGGQIKMSNFAFFLKIDISQNWTSWAYYFMQFFDRCCLWALHSTDHESSFFNKNPLKFYSTFSSGQTYPPIHKQKGPNLRPLWYLSLHYIHFAHAVSIRIKWIESFQIFCPFSRGQCYKTIPW